MSTEPAIVIEFYSSAANSTTNSGFKGKIWQLFEHTKTSSYINSVLLVCLLDVTTISVDNMYWMLLM